MRMNISVPDDLAAEVRRHGIPVSEIAQAALRQAVADSRSARLADLREGIAQEAESSAGWRRAVAEDYPDDDRNIRCADTLDGLAGYVRGLPDDDPQLAGLLDLQPLERYFETAQWHGERWQAAMGRLGFYNRIPPQQALGHLADAAAEDLAEFESEMERELDTEAAGDSGD